MIWKWKGCQRSSRLEQGGVLVVNHRALLTALLAYGKWQLKGPGLVKRRLCLRATLYVGTRVEVRIGVLIGQPATGSILFDSR